MRLPALGKLTAEHARMLVGELEAWEGDLRELRKEWDAYWSKWELEPPKASENPWLSKMSAPHPFSHVETLIPRILGEDAKMAYEAIDHPGDTLKAHVMGAAASYQMVMMGFESEARTTVRQACVTGYTIGKLGWVRIEEETDVDIEETKYDDRLMTEYTTRSRGRAMMVVKNQAFYETVDVYDFVFPITARDIDHASAVWQRRWMTMDELRADAEMGVYKESDLEHVTPGDENRWRESQQARLETQNVTSQGADSTAVIEAKPGDDPQGLVEVWERWEDNRLTTIANRQWVIRDEANPFTHRKKPFCDWSPIPRPFRMFGIGVVRVLNDLAEDLNTLRRQRRDAVTWTLNPGWKVAVGVERSVLSSIYPGVVVEMDDPEKDLVPLTTPQIDYAAAVQEEEMIIQDMQRATGAYEYLSGNSQQAGGSRTATGVATITAEGNKRVGEMVKTFDDRFMFRFGWLLGEMLLQFLDAPIAVDMDRYPDAAKAWQDLRQSDILPRGLHYVGQEQINLDGRVRPIPTIGQDKQANEVARQGAALQFVQSIAPMLAAPTPVVNPSELVRYLAQEFSIPDYAIQKILDTKGVPSQAPPASDSGPSGENLPTTDVVGAPAVPGGSGPYSAAA